MTQLPDQSQFGDYGEWPGRDVLDSGGERLGDVREIYLDRETGRPEWVLVQVEPEESRFVPLADANVESRTIRVAHTATVVRSAPAIGAEPRIDQNQERELYAHYHIGYSSEESGSGLPDDNVPPPEPEHAPEPTPREEPAPFRTDYASSPPPGTLDAAPPGTETPGVPPTEEPATLGFDSPGSYSAPPSADTPDAAVETPPVEPPSTFFAPPAADTPATTAPSEPAIDEATPFTPPAAETPAPSEPAAPIFTPPESPAADAPAQPAGTFPPSAESGSVFANPAVRMAAIAAVLALLLLILRRRR
jgi:sporulation protein YlmC with PRC-barrel domain